MPFYHCLGEIPRKRHTQFRDPSGRLYHEELIGNEGFSGLSSLLYHVHPPTQVIDVRLLDAIPWRPVIDQRLRHRHLRTARLAPGGDPLSGRHPLLYNGDVAISMAQPVAGQDSFYRNGQSDEIVYVSEGQGTLETIFGDLPYRKGDYVVIPRGIIHRWRCDPAPHRLLVIECRGIVRTPRRYRSPQGQLLEHSPYCERDIRRPERLDTHHETGSFEVRIKRDNAIHSTLYAVHPFDVIGWDGYYYPWILNIADFEPITGRIHQPPPVHQTFEGEGFVVCSFVPRLFDYHPQSIPVPYHHSNIGSDEVIYYASDRFMSRRGIEYGSITHHPDGLPHGPHPGTIEASLGAAATDELAVMIDTFRPLHVAGDAEAIDDPEYPTSWTIPGDPPGR
jgi:homogentisate 1,2-dioxygenase